jgi:hypothetical protein
MGLSSNRKNTVTISSKNNEYISDLLLASSPKLVACR